MNPSSIKRWKEDPVVFISEDSRRIQFALPIYLSHKRTDELALKFYLFALNFSVKEEEQIKYYLAHSFCEGNLSGVDPYLHQKCGEIFSGMSSDQQGEIKRQSEENQISSKLKKIKMRPDFRFAVLALLTPIFTNRNLEFKIIFDSSGLI